MGKLKCVSLKLLKPLINLRRILYDTYDTCLYVFYFQDHGYT